MVQMMEMQIFFRGDFVNFLAYYSSHLHSVGKKDAPCQHQFNKHIRSTPSAAVAAIEARNYLEKYRHFHHLHHKC